MHKVSLVSRFTKPISMCKLNGWRCTTHVCLCPMVKTSIKASIAELLISASWGWLFYVVTAYFSVCVRTSCTPSLCYVHFSAIASAKPCSPSSPFSVIQWKIPRLPLCWLRKHRGCNQSSGCFGRNPSCLSLALLPHQRSADYWGLRWERGWEMGSGHGEGGADTPLTNTTVTSDEVLSKEWLCHRMNY